MNENPFQPPDATEPNGNSRDVVNSPQDQNDLTGEMIIYANLAVLLFLLAVVFMGLLTLRPTG